MEYEKETDWLGSTSWIPSFSKRFPLESIESAKPAQGSMQKKGAPGFDQNPQ